MKITVLNTIELMNVPSGSGIVKSGDIYYVIGDDSPFLFSLDKTFNVISKIPLLDAVTNSDERIIKSKKPDFEAMEMIEENELIVFGSGSKSPHRDIFMRILLNPPLIIERYVITDLYDKLRKLPLLKDSELNIEATAYYNNRIYLFNRTKNIIICFDYKELLNYIKGDCPYPNPEVTEFHLPKINGIGAGFSGATTLKNEAKIIFTASVENTDNAYDDGEILGSFIGMIDISTNNISNSFNYCHIPCSTVNLKVESVTVEEENSVGETKIILITDDDKGNSVILKCILYGENDHTTLKGC